MPGERTSSVHAESIKRLGRRAIFTKKFMQQFLLYPCQHFKVTNCFAGGDFPEGWLLVSFHFSLWKGRPVTGRRMKGKGSNYSQSWGSLSWLTAKRMKRHITGTYLVVVGECMCMWKLTRNISIHQQNFLIPSPVMQNSILYHSVSYKQWMKMLAKPINAYNKWS